MIADNRSGNDGFFATLKTSAQDGFSTVFNQILPVWAAKELNVQRQDQLADPVYDSEYAPPKAGSYPSTTESAGNTQKTGLLFDNVNISGTALLGVAVAAVVGIAIAKL